MAWMTRPRLSFFTEVGLLFRGILYTRHVEVSQLDNFLELEILNTTKQSALASKSDVYQMV